MTPIVALPLAIELVPVSCWYRNVRANVSPLTWSALQRLAFAAAGGRCEICGGVGPTHPVECHEVWHFDDRLRVQRLDRLIALCPLCHRVKHMGFTLAQGRADRTEEALAWFCRINDVGPAVAVSHIQSVFAEYQARSQHRYQLDVELLRRYSVDIDSRGVELGHAPTGIEY